MNIKPRWEEKHPPMRAITNSDVRFSKHTTVKFLSRDEVREIRRQQINSYRGQP